MVVVFAGGGRGEGGWLVVEGMGVCRESGSVVVGGRAVVWVVDGYCRVGGCPGLGRAVEGRYLWCRGVVLPVGFCLRWVRLRFEVVVWVVMLKKEGAQTAKPRPRTPTAFC